MAQLDSRAEIHSAGIKAGTPTPEQAAAQAEHEALQLRKQINALEQRAGAMTPEECAKYNIQLTGSPNPNRAQRRAAEKRLRRRQP